ncbi:globin family protein [Thermobifida cellulosilytica]|uniref:Uncharacterized protein n=1 Tax=Thermobifida cellulosilytica TB100 TaxID=665004 RepID=A0A147KIZ4_THECS|nr:globin [Thermobifida cellulosilytica]KUP97258.1 hypothetical protein AC529_07735 [Thermobifida cellulosilytica TB100]
MTVMATREPPRPDARIVSQVQRLCEDLLAQPEVLAEHLYDHLFRLLPGCRELFPADMGVQHVRMAQVLVQVVRHLDKPDDDTWQRLRELGAYHYVRWGLGLEEYRCVGHALIEAARDISLEWVPSVGSAWVTVYEWIVSAMLSGAEEAARSPERHRSGYPAARGRHAGPRSGEGSGKPTVAS